MIGDGLQVIANWLEAHDPYPPVLHVRSEFAMRADI